MQHMRTATKEDLDLMNPAYQGELSLAGRMAQLWFRFSAEQMSGDELREWRKQYGWSRAALAANLGVHYQSVSGWELPGVKVPHHHIAAIRALPPFEPPGPPPGALLAAELRVWRQDNGYSRDSLAAVLGVHWQTITNWEREGCYAPSEHSDRIRDLPPVAGAIPGAGTIGVGEWLLMPADWVPSQNDTIPELFRSLRKHRGKRFEVQPRAFVVAKAAGRGYHPRDHDGRFVVVRVR